MTRSSTIAVAAYNNADGRTEQTKNEESGTQPESLTPPNQTTQADTSNGDTTASG